MTGSVLVTAPAKINLALHVGERRPDRYHDLESLVAFAQFGDRIRLEPAAVLSLVVTGPFASVLSAGDDNLVLRAARRLDESRGARITLEKNIPVAAGLGGGSADAAAVLRGLNDLWNLERDTSAMREIAAGLGADVPVCIDSCPAWMEGRGERITRLSPLPRFWLLLVNPGVPVSTADVFAKLESRRGLGFPCPNAPFKDLRSLVYFLQSTTNDLEVPARSLAPVIGEVLDELARLPGVLLARMSGSGATCFGIFESEHELRPAEAMLTSRRHTWWVTGTPVPARSTGIPVFVQ